MTKYRFDYSSLKKEIIDRNILLKFFLKNFEKNVPKLRHNPNSTKRPRIMAQLKTAQCS